MIPFYVYAEIAPAPCRSLFLQGKSSGIGMLLALSRWRGSTIESMDALCFFASL
jgi:hypothetical protein